jgi:DNA-binding LacI/PurR family transcriptional regulator
MSPPRATTIRDVAAQAGVSIQTVSRVLNDKAEVTDATRKRVQSVIQSLHYRPNLAARGLPQRRTYVLGVLVSFASDRALADPFVMEFIRGLDHEAGEHDYSLLLCTPRPSGEAGLAIERVLRSHYVDGLVAIGAGAWLGDQHAPRDIGVPLIGLGYEQDWHDAPVVHADDRGGASAALRHLLQLGHTRIGIIGARPGTHDRLRALEERMDGIADALGESGAAAATRTLAMGDLSVGGGYQAAAELLASGRKPTAIFALNDQMAIGASRYLREQGLRIPDDCSIVGFDDIPAAALHAPPLTTVRQPAFEMGRTAAGLLFGLLSRPISKPASESILPAELVVRASSATRGRRTGPTH